MKKYFNNKDFFSPNRNNEHNYMLDTTVFNDLCFQEDMISKLEKSLDYDFKYYYTYIQIAEMCGYKYNVEKNILEEKIYKGIEAKKEKFEEIIDKLDVKETFHIGTGVAYTFILDGSTCALPNQDIDFCESIRKGKMKHNEDMIIAESSVLFNCTLVTNDNKLLNKIRKTYPEKAIKLEELLEKIEKLLNNDFSSYSL